MRSVFFGTPEIAVPSLDALASISEVVAVVCQPDRPAGRGLALKAPPVKQRALELGLSVHQPTKVKNDEFWSWMNSLQADFALVIAYGRILTQRVLDAPKFGCLNLHASILPAYRGASPIQWAIVQGETETGVCLMQMDAGMDTGPVHCCRRTPIDPNETAGELSVRIAAIAADVVREDLIPVAIEKRSPVDQDHKSATHAPILTKDHGRIAWDRSAQQVHDLVRGTNPWPGAHTRAKSKLLKVHATRVVSSGVEGEPGRVLVADSRGLLVACGAGVVEVVSLQFEGRKAMAARDAIAGRSIALGDVLGGSPQAEG